MDNRECPHCSKSFKGITGLKIHLKKTYPCNTLKNDFLSKNDFEGLLSNRITAALTVPGLPVGPSQTLDEVITAEDDQLNDNPGIMQ